MAATRPTFRQQRQASDLLRMRKGEAGFVLAASTLVVSISLLSAATLATLAVSALSNTRQRIVGNVARDAAESGLNRIVSELNTAQNRRLLVNAALLNRSATLINSDPRLVNPCSRIPDPDVPSTTLSTIRRPAIGKSAEGSTFPSESSMVGQEIKIPGSGGRLRYTLIGITNDSASSEFTADGAANPAFNVSVGVPGPPGRLGRSGRIALQVRGTYHDRDGRELSRFNLRRVLAIIPKCCGQSLGGFTGTGSTTAFVNNLWGPSYPRACPLDAGNAVIVGAGRRTSSGQSNLTSSTLQGSLAVPDASQVLRRVVNGNDIDSTIGRLFCTVNSTTLDSSYCPYSTQQAPFQTLLALRDLPMPPVPTPASSNPYAFSGSFGGTEIARSLTSAGTGFASAPSTRWMRMRLCDAHLESDWARARLPRVSNPAVDDNPNRAESVVVLRPSGSTTSTNAGCNIVVNDSPTTRYVETLRTSDFSNWATRTTPYPASETQIAYRTGNLTGPFANTATRPADNGVALKNKLGQLCTQVNWQLQATNTGMASTGGVARPVVYCNLTSLQLVNALIVVDTTPPSGVVGSIPLILDFRNSLRTVVDGASTQSLLSGVSLIGNPTSSTRDQGPVGIVQVNTALPSTNPGDVAVFGCGGSDAAATNVTCPAQTITTGYAGNVAGTVVSTTGYDFALDGVFVYMPRGVVYSQGLQDLPVSLSLNSSYGYRNSFNTTFPVDPWAPSSISVDPIFPDFRSAGFCASLGSGTIDCTNLRFRGVMWVNQILANAGITFTVPDYALARHSDPQLLSSSVRVLSPLQWFPAVTGLTWRPDLFELAQDYVARSVISEGTF